MKAVVGGEQPRVALDPGDVPEHHEEVRSPKPGGFCHGAYGMPRVISVAGKSGYERTRSDLGS